jgi:hypothetical protein
MSEKVILLFDRLYVEAKTLPASALELVSILDGTNQGKALKPLQIHEYFNRFLNNPGFDIMWNTVRRWSESRIS